MAMLTVTNIFRLHKKEIIPELSFKPDCVKTSSSPLIKSSNNYIEEFLRRAQVSGIDVKESDWEMIDKKKAMEGMQNEEDEKTVLEWDYMDEVGGRKTLDGIKGRR